MATMDDSCMETVMVDGKPKRRRKKSGCGKVTKYGRRSIPEGVKKVVGAVATGTAAVLANKKFGLVDKAKEAMGLKKGGAVKKKMAKGGSTFGMLSVKAGVDKNPKPTAADRIAGAKMQKGGMTKSKKK